MANKHPEACWPLPPFLDLDLDLAFFCVFFCVRMWCAVRGVGIGASATLVLVLVFFLLQVAWFRFEVFVNGHYSRGCLVTWLRGRVLGRGLHGCVWDWRCFNIGHVIQGQQAANTGTCGLSSVSTMRNGPHLPIARCHINILGIISSSSPQKIFGDTKFATSSFLQVL